MIDWSDWKHLANRYRAIQPRRMLALDGGGVRGFISLHVLARLEQLLADHYSGATGMPVESFRLCQFFDYVAGTSTGAIIAAAIARGMTVAEILSVYRKCSTLIFKRRPWHQRWKSFYDHEPLTRELQRIFTPEATLEPEHLQSLLLVVTRNAKTDSPWPITSNPAAKYNAPDHIDCNLRVPLWKLLRASTAAPVYFAQERLDLSPDDPTRSAYFVDGGTTAYNNPAFLLFRMATEPSYRVQWPRGERDLLVISVGTGSVGAAQHKPIENVLSDARVTIAALLAHAAYDQDVNCRVVGRCTFGPKLDSELGDLVPRRDPDNPQSPLIPLAEDCGRDFLYVRYNIDLTTAGLNDLGISNVLPRQVAALDAVRAIPHLESIGAALAKKVRLEHLGDFTKAPLFVSHRL